MSAIGSSISMQDWALSRIEGQKWVKEGAVFHESIPEKVLHRRLFSWIKDSHLEFSTIDSMIQGRVLLVFMPKAHNILSTRRHLPTLVSQAFEIKKRYSTQIVVSTIDSIDSIHQWSSEIDPNHLIRYIPDVDGEFALSLGVASWSERMGLSCRQVAMIIDGVVLKILSDEAHQIINTGTNVQMALEEVFGPSSQIAANL